MNLEEGVHVLIETVYKGQTSVAVIADFDMQEQHGLGCCQH